MSTTQNEHATAAFAAGTPAQQEAFAEESYRRFFGVDGFNVFKLNLLQQHQQKSTSDLTKKDIGNLAFMALHAPLEFRKTWLAALIQTTDALIKQ
jgi:hypothetical protein